MKPHQGSHKNNQPDKKKPAEKKRFLIVKLEERIAPTCHYNPQGKLVGCGTTKHQYCI